jgi:hypothetical protein
MRVDLAPAKWMALKAIANQYRSNVRELVEIAVDELIAAHQKPARKPSKSRTRVRSTGRAPVSVRPVAAGRTYAEKPCAKCGRDFSPTGPRSKYCGRCQDAPVASSSSVAASPTVVWNGTMGRQGVPLPGGRV